MTLRAFALLVALAGAASAAAAEPPLVSGVSVHAPAGQNPADYEPLLSLKAGQPLSLKAVRRSVQRLYELGRFANVSVLENPDGPGRVQLVFVLEPQRTISALSFSGAVHLAAADLRAASGLQVGADYSEDRVQTARASIRSAYARLGWNDVRIEAQARPGPEGMDLAFAVLEGTPTRVASLELAGDPGGIRPGQVFTLKEGDILDRDVLASDVARLKALLKSGGRYRAQVEAPQIVAGGPGQAIVRLLVQAGPRIQLRYQGNRALSDAELAQVIGYDGEELLDRALVQEIADRVEHAYHLLGYPDARVIPREIQSPDGGRALIVFQALEGQPLRVRQVVFAGQKALSGSELMGVVRDTLGEGGSPARAQTTTAQIDEAGLTGRVRVASGVSPVPGDQVWNEETWAKVPEALQHAYREAGFLDAQVGAPQLDIDEVRRTAVVTVPITEGRRTFVAGVSFPGGDRYVNSGERVASPLEAGDPLSESRLSGEAAAIRSWYGQQGYLYATVDPQLERPALAPERALVRFAVNEGPRVQAGRIFVQGNTRTRESVVRDTLLFQEGSVLGSDGLSGSQQRLMRLGIFRTAVVRPVEPETAEPVKDVLVDLRERPSRAFEVGGGLSIADGPRAFAEYQQRNLAGSNLELTARAKVNYQVFRSEVLALPPWQGLERFLDLGLRYPRFYGLPIDVGTRIDFIHEQDIRPSYAVTRFSTPLGVDWRISQVLLASIVGEVESNYLDKSPNLEPFAASAIDKARLRFPQGLTVLGSVRPSFTVDLRDNRLQTHSGFLLATVADYSQDLGGSYPIDFIKLQSTATGYIPLAPRWTLALSLGGGKIVPLSSDSVNFPPKNFFMGGVGSLRGFPQDGLVPEDQRKQLRQEIADCSAVLWRGAGNAYCSDAARALQSGQAVPSLGGEVFGLGRAEVRFPIYGELSGATFFEAGNLWLDSKKVEVARIDSQGRLVMHVRSAAGFGLRYDTPVGPAALDVGFNLQPDHQLNESTAALHFSIGLF